MKLMIFGIAVILFGISISVMIMEGYYIFNLDITMIIGRILPIIGMILVIVGFFSKDKQEK